MSDRGYRALIVDDEAIARKMVAGTFVQAGFACDVARDGNEALRMLETRKYDLVVTDIRMPNKHGHSLAQDLLASPDRPVIVVHTVLDDPRLTEDLLVRGVDDIVYKPTNYQTLAARAKVLVEKRRSNRATLSTHSSSPAASSQGAPNQAEASRGELNPAAPNPDSPNPDPSSPSAAGIAARQETPVDTVSEAELTIRLSEVSEVLPISENALEVYRLATVENAGTAQLARAIAADAVLSTDVLRTGNSAHYNRSGNRTADLEQLIVRVGRRRIGELALASSVRNIFTKHQIPWLDLQLAWKRSVAASLAIGELSKQGGHQGVDQGLFLSALMHPLGRVVLAAVFPEHHEKLTRHCSRNGEPLRVLETRAFGRSHAQILAGLLSRWKIPADVTSPLENSLASFPLDKSKPERERMRAELLMVSIFIGRLVTGFWEPWDLVDIPSSTIVKRLGIGSLTEIIAATRNRLRELARLQGSTADDPDSPLGDACTRKVGYWKPNAEPVDFLAALLPALGVAAAGGSGGGGKMRDIVVANCLDREASEVLSQLKPRPGQRLVIVTTESRRQQFADVGQVIALPTTFRRLCDAIDRACAETAHIETAALPAEAQVAGR